MDTKRILETRMKIYLIMVEKDGWEIAYTTMVSWHIGIKRFCSMEIDRRK